MLLSFSSVSFLVLDPFESVEVETATRVSGWTVVSVTLAFPSPLLTISKPPGLLSLSAFHLFHAETKSLALGAVVAEILMANVPLVPILNSLSATAVSAVIIIFGASPVAPV